VRETRLEGFAKFSYDDEAKAVVQARHVREFRETPMSRRFWADRFDRHIGQRDTAFASFRAADGS
jgi:hypothetical protein